MGIFHESDARIKRMNREQRHQFKVYQKSAEIYALIELSRAHVMTESDIRNQRVSFIFGQLGGRVSKHDIEKSLDKMEGKS